MLIVPTRTRLMATMAPGAGDGGGKIVVEGPPEDLVVHAGRWARHKALLRSHTGEALAAFGLR